MVEFRQLVSDAHLLQTAAIVSACRGFSISSELFRERLEDFENPKQPRTRNTYQSREKSSHRSARYQIAINRATIFGPPKTLQEQRSNDLSSG